MTGKLDCAQREFGLGSANTQIEGSFASVFQIQTFELRQWIRTANTRRGIAQLHRCYYDSQLFVMADLWLNDTYRITAGLGERTINKWLCGICMAIQCDYHR